MVFRLTEWFSIIPDPKTNNDTAKEEALLLRFSRRAYAKCHATEEGRKRCFDYVNLGPGPFEVASQDP